MGFFEIGRQVINILQAFTPLLIIVIAVVFAASVLRWSKRVGLSFKEITSNPASFIFGLLIIALFVYLYFDKIKPLFDKL